jgi:hypothetical protein
MGVSARIWACVHGLTAKFDAIVKKIIEDEAAQAQATLKRIEVRELLGDKVMQELIANWAKRFH